jgi:hypothetical protein
MVNALGVLGLIGNGNITSNKLNQNTVNPEFNMADIAEAFGKSIATSNSSYHFLSIVANHLNEYSSADLAQIQNQIEEFSLSTQFVSKSVSTLIKDVDGLIRMQ